MPITLNGSSGITFPDGTVQPTSYLPAGSIISFAGTTPPSGFLTCPTSATTLSRTTYAALFAAIGTTWGVGDGSTTFGMPWFAAGYVPTQANANVGTATVGQVISHTHSYLRSAAQSLASPAAAGSGVTSSSAATTGDVSTGASTANLAAGSAVLMCVKY
jgi:microcystin-dependent protein